MGRKHDAEMMSGLEKRLGGPAPVAEPVAPEPSPPAAARKPSARDGMKFIGFYANEDQTEKLRVLAFETRREKQDLMREALNLLFKEHGIQPSRYKTGTP